MKGRFELVTPEFPAETFRVLSFRGREELSKPFVFRLNVRASGLEMERDLLGSPALLSLHGDGGARQIAGVIAAARLETVLANGDGAAYRLRLVPRFATLGLTRNSRIFQEQSVPEIADAILEKHGVERAWKLAREYPQRTYCVQYQESDLEFLQRILAEEGIFYAFGTSGEASEAPRDVVIFGDDASAYDPIAGAPALRFHEPDGLEQSKESVLGISFQRRMRPGASLLSGFDFRRPAVRLTADATSDAPAASPLHRVYEHEMDWSKWGLRAEAPGIHLAQQRERDALAEGQSTCPRLSPGRSFDLEEHPRADMNARFAVVRVEHEGTIPETGASATVEQVYTNRFSCVHAEVVARPRRPARVFRQVMETATVVGPSGEEIHTDEHGRVKVQFHWDREGQGDDHSSCWIRAMMPWAGSAWGAQFVPRVGMEVVVTFSGGDTDRPLILGAVYNGTNVPPFSLPAKKTQSGFRTRSTPGGAGSNELRFDDAAGQEQLYLHAQRDLVEVVEHDRMREVRGKESVRVAETRTVEILQDHVRHVAGNEIVSIDKSLIIHVTGAHIFHIDGKTGDVAPPPPPEVNANQGGPGAPPPPPGAEDDPAVAEAALKQLVTRSARKKAAELTWLAEQLPDSLYSEGSKKQEAARKVSAEVTDLYFAVRSLVSSTSVGELPAQAAPLEEALSAARYALQAQIEQALQPAPPALQRFQGALVDQLVATDRTAASAHEMLAKALSGEAQPGAAEILGTLRGGGGGPTFDEDKDDNKQGFNWPAHNDKDGKEDVPKGESKGKGSTMVITGGGTLKSDDGFRITSGGSKIEITPGGILIEGPTVTIKGKPINLNP